VQDGREKRWQWFIISDIVIYVAIVILILREYLCQFDLTNYYYYYYYYYYYIYIYICYYKWIFTRWQWWNYSKIKHTDTHITQNNTRPKQTRAHTATHTTKDTLYTI
jgi:hypothetical protein